MRLFRPLSLLVLLRFRLDLVFGRLRGFLSRGGGSLFGFRSGLTLRRALLARLFTLFVLFLSFRLLWLLDGFLEFVGRGGRLECLFHGESLFESQHELRLELGLELEALIVLSMDNGRVLGGTHHLLQLHNEALVVGLVGEFGADALPELLSRGTALL